MFLCHLKCIWATHSLFLSRCLELFTLPLARVLLLSLLLAGSGTITGRALLGATCGLSLHSILSGTTRSGEKSMGALALVRSTCVFGLSVASVYFFFDTHMCVSADKHFASTRHNTCTSPMHACIDDPRFLLQPEQEAVLQSAVPGPERDRHLQGRQQHHRKHHVLGEYRHRDGSRDHGNC